MTTDLALYRRVYGKLLDCMARVGTRILLIELGDSNPDIEMPVLPSGYTTKQLKPSDLMAWTTPEYGLSESFLIQAQARGDRCVANFFQNELVGYGFVTQSYAPVTDQTAVKIDERLLYRYKGWTHPAHRRNHLSHARGRINSRLFPKQQGQHMVSYVEVQNFPSRLKHADVHPVCLGYSMILRVFGKEYLFNSPIAKRYGFQLVPRTDQLA